MAGLKAWVGRKPCGCPVFARLCVATRARPLEQVAKGLDIRKVPVDQAAVVICGCDG